MMEGAVKQGLDGVITEHDIIWSEEEIRLQSSYPQLTILRGIEVHTAR